MAFSLGKFSIKTTNVAGLSRAGAGNRAGLSTRVKVYGAKEAIAKLGLVRQTVYRDTGLITRDAAVGVRATARILVPKKERHLYNGIFEEQIAPYDWRVHASSMEGGADREYADYVENGWSGHPEPEHFMRRAVIQQTTKSQGRLFVLAKKVESMF